MERREFLGFIGGAAVWPRPARAQQQRREPKIGFLNGASYELSAYLVKAFHQGLGETGFAEGRNVAFEYRSAEGQYTRLPALAADLVRQQVDVIAATGTPTGLPAKAATATIPIVFVTGSDPVEQGLVPSFSRPGGNLTGVTTLAVELGQKRVELLRELVPTAKAVAILVNPPIWRGSRATCRGRRAPSACPFTCCRQARTRSWKPCSPTSPRPAPACW